ncbi:MAG: MFS transporter [Phycisphaerae bacterium]|nr:MFS transporter [Phycisphaerae bacterium]
MHDTAAHVPPAPPAAPPVRVGVVLTAHILYTLLNALLFTNMFWLMPMLVRLRFGSDDPTWRDWQTTLVTAAVPIFMMLSIFWHELLRRTTFRTYLIVFWLVGVLPLGCVALAQSFWQMFACHVVATIGLGGQAPVNGKLLKHFYADAVRGRVYALLNVVALASSIASIYLFGVWVEADHDAFRVYFPVAAGLQLVGIALLLWLAQHTRLDAERPASQPPAWSDLLKPILHMGAVLRADRTFLRYERAFMTYGAAYMLCDALLPVLGTELGLRYEDYAHSTQVVTKLVTLVATLPMGWLMDRVGAVRTSGIAFAVLALYPALLLTARGTVGIGVASVAYGLGLAGVQMGWMLGPVNLAGTPDKVPQYVAIHATLVGVRGVIFQGLGMLLYKLTGSFTWPLIAAAAAFLWAAIQMDRLQGALRQQAATATPPSPPRPVATTIRAASGSERIEGA